MTIVTTVVPQNDVVSWLLRKLPS